jgi:hypothetical protein
VTDHRSTNGSAEMLAAAARQMPLTLRPFPHRDFRQGQVLTALARAAFTEGADWVLPLDADEFPDVEDRRALEARLAGVAEGSVALLRWRNAHPLARGRFEAAGRYELSAAPSPFRKVALPRGLFEAAPAFVLTHGSHAVELPGATEPPPAAEVGHLRHLPICSPERLVFKVAARAAALAARSVRRPGESTHYGEIAEALGRDGPTPPLLRRIALRYGEPGAAKAEPPVTVEEDWSPRGAPLDLPAGAPSAAAAEARERAVGWRPPPRFPPQLLSVRVRRKDVALVRDWRGALGALAARAAARHRPAAARGGGGGGR